MECGEEHNKVPWIAQYNISDTILFVGTQRCILVIYKASQGTMIICYRETVMGVASKLSAGQAFWHIHMQI